MKLRPLADRIIVQQNDAEDVTKGGIILPDAAKEKPMTGTVLAVGAGKWENGERTPMDCCVGDTVYIAKFGGSRLMLEGKEYLILREQDVIAVVEAGE